MIVRPSVCPTALLRRRPAPDNDATGDALSPSERDTTPSMREWRASINELPLWHLFGQIANQRKARRRRPKEVNP
jgi:hypothetical protein